MKRIRKIPIISTKNIHLMNILDNDYFIELGDVSLSVMNKIIHRKPVYINDLVDRDIINNGLGKIINENNNDFDLQLDFIKKLNQKSSALRFYLTCGTARYYDEDDHELFVPVVLIPLQYDYQTSLLQYVDEIVLNNHFIAYIKKIVEEKIDSIRENFENRGKSKEENEYRDILEKINSLRPEKIESIIDVDNICIKLNTILKTVYKLDENLIGTTNFLTLIEIDEVNNQFAVDFNIQHSKYESTAFDIVKNFYNNVNAVLPTNIDQKYILLKAHNGEIFCVDGKCGSGKTSTIINIISDAVLHNKTVLYVNHNLDALNEVRQELLLLGFHHLWTDLSSNITTLDDSNYEDLNKVHSIDLESLNELNEFSSIYHQKYLGFTYGYLLRALTERKYSGFTDNMVISNDLEKEEVKYVCQVLNDIEDNLKLVDAYPNNLWINILSSKTAPDADLTIKYTQDFLSVSNDIIGYLDKFSQENYINNIVSHHDLYEFNEELNSFKIVKPLVRWLNHDFLGEANVAAKEITEAEGASYKAQTFYENNLVDGYKTGNAEHFFGKIISSHFNISSDTKYLDRILKNNLDFENLYDLAVDTIEKGRSISHALITYFAFDKHDNQEFDFYHKLLEYSSNNPMIDEWLVECKLPNSNIFEKWDEYKKLYSIAMDKYNEFSKFVKNISKDFIQLRSILPTHNTNKVKIKRIYFNNAYAKLVKKTGIHFGIDDLKVKILEFVDLGEQIIKIIPRSSSIDATKMETWTKFLNFGEFINSLNSIQLKALNDFVNYHYHKVNYDKDILNTLKDLDKIVQITNDLENKFDYYHLPVNGSGLLDILNSMNDYVDYFKEVIASKSDIYQIYKSNEIELTCENLIELMNIDFEYSNAISLLNNNHDHYVELFGSGYQGMDTNIQELSMAINHFDSFKDRFTSNDYLKKVLNNENNLFDKFLDEQQKFIDYYQSWYEALKKFSSSFFRGQMNLQLETFVDVVKTLNKYNEKIDQVEPSLKIEKDLEVLYDYKLKEIPEGIHKGIYKQGLADNYYYSTLNKYYHDMFDDNIKKKQSYKSFELNRFIDLSNEYIENEVAFCNQNIKRLRILNPSMVKKANKNVNRIDNYRPIAIADTESLNTISDLSMFDIILVDDAHLGIANYYYPVFKANQYIIFGDETFNPSYNNALFNRLNSPSFVKLSKRYIDLTPEYGNQFTESNKYIYNSNPSTVINHINSLEEYCGHIADSYLDNNKKINVIVSSITQAKNVYSIIVDRFTSFYEMNEIRKIFNQDISFIIMDINDAKKADLTCIYFDEFINNENKVNLLFKNYIMSNQVLIDYSIEQFNNEPTINYLDKVVGHIEPNNYSNIVLYQMMFKKLEEKGIKNIEFGSGVIKLILNNNRKMLGVVILGEDNAVRYSYVDDYQFYCKTYEKFGWQIVAFSLEELYQDLDGCLESITKKYEELA